LFSREHYDDNILRPFIRWKHCIARLKSDVGYFGVPTIDDILILCSKTLTSNIWYLIFIDTLYIIFFQYCLEFIFIFVLTCYRIGITTFFFLLLFFVHRKIWANYKMLHSYCYKLNFIFIIVLIWVGVMLVL